jgi:hypothetical protein
MRAKPTTPDTLGSIRADEVLPVRVMAKRLGMNVKSLAHAKREGLRTVKFGRFDYVLGRDVLAFFERLAQAQADGNGKGGEQ